jgi:hypothetical protein
MGSAILLGVLLAASGLQEPAAQPAAAAKAVALSDAEQERFLLQGEIVRRRSAPGGITASERATLRLGDFEHECHIQRIDQHKPSFSLGGTTEVDFHDSFRGNVAAYRLDRMLGVRMTPVTVKRNDSGGPAAYTWWVDDVLMDEKERLAKKTPAPDVEAWNKQMFVVRIFDQLIYNFDRNLGNLLIDRDWRVWMIDHTRAFKIFKDIKSEKNLGTRCERGLLAALRRLDHATLKAAMEDILNPGQITGILGRRDLIVRYFDRKIAELGEDAVLYDLPPRVNSTTSH